jgi:hypothetical protein
VVDTHTPSYAIRVHFVTAPTGRTDCDGGHSLAADRCPRFFETVHRRLASGIQTGNLARAHRAMLDPNIPFGGVKDSGFGREYGPEGLAAYTRTKSVVVSLD